MAKDICEMLKADYSKYVIAQPSSGGDQAGQAKAIDQEFQNDFKAYLEKIGIRFIYRDSRGDPNIVLGLTREIIGFEDSKGVVGPKGRYLIKEGPNWDPRAERGLLFETFTRGYAKELFQDQEKAAQLKTDLALVSQVKPRPYIADLLASLDETRTWSVRDKIWFEEPYKTDPLQRLRNHLKDRNGIARYVYSK